MNLKTEIWNGHAIRFVEREPGDWRAVLSDVASALTLRTDGLAARMEKGNISTVTLPTEGGPQAMNIINEYGIYDSVFASHKKEAKEFKRWVYEMLRTLRQSSGLEGFQIFRMLDKQHQREMMTNLSKGLRDPVRIDFIKANGVTNKTVSSLFGFPKLVKKGDMTPEMLVARQPVLDDTVNLMVANDSFRLGLSVSEQVYDKYLHPDSQRKKTGA